MELQKPSDGTINLEIAINSEGGARKLEDLILPIQDAIYSLLQSEDASVTIRVKKGMTQDDENESIVNTLKIPEVVLPSIPNLEIEKGWGAGTFKKRGRIDRRYFLYQLLREENLDDDIIDTAGINTSNMMRKESYHLVEIPQIERQVLVCDEEGEATFVSEEKRPIHFYLENDKRTLMETPGMSRVIFRDLEQWRFEMRALLTGKGLLELLEAKRKKMVQLLLPFEPPTPRDVRYYSQREIVYHDLSRFAAASGLDSGIDLKTPDFKNTIAVCHNGERVHGVTYLKHAGVALGYGRTGKDAASNQADIIDHLKRIAGFDINKNEYPKRDLAYYENANIVKADLEAIAQAVGIDDYTDLTTTYLSSNYFVCGTGEKVNCMTYLRHAALAFGYGSDASGWHTELKEASRYCPEALRDLKKITGWTPPIPPPKRDKNYYQDPANVAADLKKFADCVGVGSIDELRTTKMSSYLVTCNNGETVSLGRYVKNAGVALGIVADSKKAGSNIGYILDSLKGIAKTLRDNSETWQPHGESNPDLQDENLLS